MSTVNTNVVDTGLLDRVQRLLAGDISETSKTPRAGGATGQEFALALRGVLQHKDFQTLPVALRTRLVDLGRALGQQETLPYQIRADLNEAMVSAMTRDQPTVRTVSSATSVAAARTTSGRGSASSLEDANFTNNTSPSSRVGSPSSESLSVGDAHLPRDSGIGSSLGLPSGSLSPVGTQGSLSSVSSSSRVRMTGSTDSIAGGSLASKHFQVQAEVTGMLVCDSVFGTEERADNLGKLRTILNGNAEKAGKSGEEINALFNDQEVANGAMLRAMLLLLTTGRDGKMATRVSSENNEARANGKEPVISLATLVGHGGRQIFEFDSNAEMQAALNYLCTGESGSEAARAAKAPNPEDVARGKKEFKMPMSTLPTRNFSSHLTNSEGEEEALKASWKHPITSFDKIVSKNKRHLRISPYIGMTAQQVAELMGIDWSKCPVPADAVFGPKGVLYHMSGADAGNPVYINKKVVALGEMYFELRPRKEVKGKAKDDDDRAFLTMSYESVPPGEGIFGMQYTDITGTKGHDGSSNAETAAKDRSPFGGCKVPDLVERGLAPENVPARLGGVWTKLPANALQQAHDAESALVELFYGTPSTGPGVLTGPAAVKTLLTAPMSNAPDQSAMSATDLLYGLSLPPAPPPPV